MKINYFEWVDHKRKLLAQTSVPSNDIARGDKVINGDTVYDVISVEHHLFGETRRDIILSKLSDGSDKG